MPVIFDTGALVRPAFDPAEFTATKWETGADKAAFANGLCRFIAADFKLILFTDKLYRRLAGTFGHIALHRQIRLHRGLFRGPPRQGQLPRTNAHVASLR